MSQSGRRLLQRHAHFLGNGTHIEAEIFYHRPTEEPVARVDFVDHEAGLKHNRVRDHGIVSGIGVLSDVEILW